MYVVVYQDRFGRTMHGVTGAPWHLLFMLVHTGVLAETESKARKRALSALIFPVVSRPAYLASHLVAMSVG